MQDQRLHRLALGVTVLAAAACTDAPVSPRTSEPLRDVQQASASEWFEHYVAMGTSVSEGWASEGIIAASQHDSWPAQLTRMAGKELTQPYIDSPGCRSPWMLPLINFRRISGEPLAPSPSLSCAPNSPGVILPARNVAITGARAINALLWTPETIPASDANAKHYARILPPRTTQVQAMQMQDPKFVSVEFGGNEVLGARGGLVLIPAVVQDPAVFARHIDEILARVRAENPQGVLLVGLTPDLTPIPGFRTSAEIWAERLTFLAGFHVAVQSDCSTSPNLVTVPLLVIPTVGAGLQSKQGGGAPVPLFCSDVPGKADGILTPADVRVLREVLAKMSNHVRTRANQHGWAYFDLSALYEYPGLKPPFSVAALMTSSAPYGLYISGDGFHPSAAGQTLLANAAAAALNARYHLGLSSTVALAHTAWQNR